jgi:hypothetical protein
MRAARDVLRRFAMLLSRVAWLAIAVAACSGSSEGSTTFPEAPYASVPVDGQPLVVELRTAPSQPPERGVVAAQLRVTDTSGAPKDGLTIDVVPWMTAHGHGVSVAPIVVPTGDGNYRVDRLQLPMPGTWQLRLELRAADLDAHATADLEVR